jgi:hypothetical protein
MYKTFHHFVTHIRYAAGADYAAAAHDVLESSSLASSWFLLQGYGACSVWLTQCIRSFLVVRWWVLRYKERPWQNGRTNEQVSGKSLAYERDRWGLVDWLWWGETDVSELRPLRAYCSSPGDCDVDHGMTHQLGLTPNLSTRAIWQPPLWRNCQQRHIWSE